MSDTLKEKQKLPMISIRFVPSPGFEEKRARVEQALQDAGFPIDFGAVCSIDFATGEEFTGYVIAHRNDGVTFVSEAASLTNVQIGHLRTVARREWLDDPHHLPLLALGLVDWVKLAQPSAKGCTHALDLTDRGRRLLGAIVALDETVTP